MSEDTRLSVGDKGAESELEEGEIPPHDLTQHSDTQSRPMVSGNSTVSVGSKGSQNPAPLSLHVSDFQANLDEVEQTSLESHTSRGQAPKEERDSQSSSQRRNEGRVRQNKRRGSDAGPPPKRRRAAAVCKFYMDGRCHQGDDCAFSHDVEPPKKTVPCKYFKSGSCRRGDSCLYSHNILCHFYHLSGFCRDGNACRFSHGQITREEYEALLAEHGNDEGNRVSQENTQDGSVSQMSAPSQPASQPPSQPGAAPPPRPDSSTTSPTLLARPGKKNSRDPRRRSRSPPMPVGVIPRSLAPPTGGVPAPPMPPLGFPLGGMPPFPMPPVPTVAGLPTWAVAMLAQGMDVQTVAEAVARGFPGPLPGAPPAGAHMPPAMFPGVPPF